MIMQTSRFATIETTSKEREKQLDKGTQHNADTIIHEHNHTNLIGTCAQN